MRFQVMKGILLYCAIFSFFALRGQEELHLSYFYAEQIAGSVVLNFELRQGSVCSGIRIERRNGDSNFEQVGLISGICGSEDYPESYVFEDEAPIDGGLSYYRIILEGLGQSNEIEVFVPNLSEKAYQIALEPQTGMLALFFSNKQNLLVSVQFFDLQGFLLEEMETQKSYLLLPDSLYGKTIFFLISNENGTIQGAFHVD